jgi:hypothetical protein
MAQRITQLGIAVSPASLPVPMDGGVDGFSALGQGFAALARPFERSDNARQQIAGLERGAIKALEIDLGQGPALTRGATPGAQAEDRASMAVYWDRVQLATSRELRQLAATTADTGTLVAKAGDYAKGMKKNMPAILQTDFDKYVEQQTAPYLAAAANRQAKLAGEADKALMEQRGADLMENARQMGFLFADTDDVGQQKAALRAVQGNIQSMVNSLTAAVQGGRMAPEVAQRALQEQLPAFNSAVLQGMFSAAPNKEAIAQAFAEGKLRVPMAQLVQKEDGTFDMQIQPRANPAVLLDLEQQNALRGWMKASIDTSRQITERRDNAAKEATAAANSRTYSDLNIGVLAGQATYETVEDAYGKGAITPEQRTSLFRDIKAAQDKQNVVVQQIGRVQTAINGGAPLDPALPDDKKALDLHYEMTAKTWAGLPADQVIARSIQYSQKIGMVPTPVKSLIRGGLRGGNAQQAMMAATTVRELQNANPQLLNDFAEDDLRLATLVGDYTDSGVPPVEALKMAKDQLTVPPATRRAREEAFDAERGRTTAERVQADNRWLEGKLNSMWTADPNLDPVMRSEFERLTRAEYARTGNMDASRSMALQMVNRVWGRTEVAGSLRYMKFAPEKFYGLPQLSPGDNARWMTEQLVDEVKASGMFNQPVTQDRLIIAPDPRFQTPDGRPAYQVSVKGADGVLYPVTGKDNMPMLWTPNWESSPEKRRRQKDYDTGVETLRQERAARMGLPVDAPPAVVPGVDGVERMEAPPNEGMNAIQTRRGQFQRMGEPAARRAATAAERRAAEDYTR